MSELRLRGEVHAKPIPCTPARIPGFEAQYTGRGQELTPMSQSGIKSEIVLALVEEFLERYRQGEWLSLREYIDRHHDLAEEIRGIFVAVALVENISLVHEAAAESSQAAAALEAVPVQQLGDYHL